MQRTVKTALGSIVFLLALVSPALAQKDFAVILKTYSSALVTVTTFDESGDRLSRATGFLLNGHGEVVTTHHSLRGAFAAEVATADGRVLPVKGLLAEDPEHDLALLTTGIGAEGSVTLPPAPSPPSLGKMAVVIGRPLSSGQQSVFYGTVAEVRDLPAFGKYYRIDTPRPAQPGSLVINMHGEFVGVTISHGNGKSGSSVAVPASAVENIKKAGFPAPASPAEGKAFINPSPAQDLYFTGMRRIWEGRYLNALGFFERAVEEDSSFASAWFMFGYCSNRAGRYHVASEAFRQALRFRPEAPEAHFYLGNAYGRLRCFQNAAESYEVAARLKPDDVNTWFRLAMAYSRLGWHEDATATFKRAVCYQYDDLGSSDGACSEVAFSRFEELMRAYIQRDWSDNLVADEHFQRGMTYMMLAKMELSLQEYEVLRRIDTKQAEILYDLISP